MWSDCVHNRNPYWSEIQTCPETRVGSVTSRKVEIRTDTMTREYDCDGIRTLHSAEILLCKLAMPKHNMRAIGHVWV